MSLQWDLTKIENHQDLCWLENKDPNKKEGDNFYLNPVTEALIHLSMFTGINRITEKNYKELALRLVELEIIGIAWLPQETDTESTSHLPSNLKRNPRKDEVKSHIGLSTNVTPRNNRQWGSEVKRIIRDQAQEFIRSYDNGEKKETTVATGS